MARLPKLLIVGLAGLCLQGCIAFPVQRSFGRSKPLATYVPQILKGQTTRAEIESTLGPPDLQAAGSTTTVNRGTPLAKYWSEFWRGLHWEDTVPYSSVDEQHVALLYLEVRSSALVVANVAVVGLAHVRANVRRSKLLILVDKTTDRVIDVTYRQEFEW